eukprot:2685002-Prorocentrum_lima.AAC.1
MAADWSGPYIDFITAEQMEEPVHVAHYNGPRMPAAWAPQAPFQAWPQGGYTASQCPGITWT